jgi:hypothetical protein
MASEVRSEVATLDPIIAQLRRDGTARLRFSQPTIEFLEQQAIRLKLPVEEMLTQAVGLFVVAVEAQARGEQVCLLNDDLEIVSEIGAIGAMTDEDEEELATLASRDDQ